MNILYILQNLDRISPNTVIMNLITNIVNEVDNIYVISLFQSGEDNYKSLLESKNINYIEYKTQLEAFKDLKTIVNILENYEILHLNQYKSNEIGNILHKYYPNLKVISTCHSEEDFETKKKQYIGNAKIASIVRLREQSNFYRKHNKVIGVSKCVQQYLVRQKCNPKNIKVIHNGVNYDDFPKVIHKKDDTTIDFCQVGHILQLKNQIFSIQLIQYLHKKGINTKLHIFGGNQWDKEYDTKLQLYVRKHNLQDNVIFYGEIPFKKLFSYLQNMNIFIMPSLTEGLPLALLEAFYFKLPAIISNNGGMKEVVNNHKTGLIVNLDDKKCFKRIYKYCKNKEYIQQGKQARKIALTKYSAKRMSQKYLKEYTKLLQSNSKV